MAKTVNLGDKYTHRITLRLNDNQYNWLIEVSKILDISPSDYIRMAVNTGMVITNEEKEKLQKGEKVGTANENVKTDSDNIV